MELVRVMEFSRTVGQVKRAARRRRFNCLQSNCARRVAPARPGHRHSARGRSNREVKRAPVEVGPAGLELGHIWPHADAKPGKSTPINASGVTRVPAAQRWFSAPMRIDALAPDYL